MFRRQLYFLSPSVLLGVLLLSGCTSAPALISKNAAVPVGVDLSGNWLVRDDPTATRMSEARGVREHLTSMTREKRSRRARSSSSTSAQVFLEFGESLKITQTYFGLFISYDRSVVEEYSYGENRLITIGPIEAQRVSGWEEQSFVVETLDDSGTTLYETWHLEPDGAVLIRDIRISKGEKNSFVHQQVFDRQ